MKAVAFGILTLCFVSFGFDAVAAPPTKVQITATKKRGEATRPKQNAEGSMSESSETVTYTISLKNNSSADLANLTVDYILFVERPRLGEKKSVPSFMERVTGSKPVAALTRQAPQVVSTDEVVLKTESVVGNFAYRDGGRMKAEDSVVGVWVRVSQGGELVGESIVPASIAKQGWDKDKK